MVTQDTPNVLTAVRFCREDPNMTALIIPFEEKKQEAICSFCKKPKSKVKKMVVSASGRAICDACLTTCTRLAEDTNPDAA